MTPARHLPLAASPLVLLANFPAVDSPCRRDFLFGAVAGSVGQMPAATTGRRDYGRPSQATALTECATFHDAAVAAQGAA